MFRHMPVFNTSDATTPQRRRRGMRPTRSGPVRGVPSRAVYITRPAAVPPDQPDLLDRIERFLPDRPPARHRVRVAIGEALESRNRSLVAQVAEGEGRPEANLRRAIGQRVE